MEVPDILKNKWTQLASVAVVALAVGATGGYFFGKKRGTTHVHVTPTPHQLSIFEIKPEATVETTYAESKKDPELEALLDEEERIVAARWAKEQLQARVENVNVDSLAAVDRFVESIKSPTSYSNISDIPTPQAIQDELESRQLEHEEPDEPITYNVFAVEDPNWVWEDELAVRTREEPYVIHQEEFMNDEMKFKQETLTYYAADDIMADSDDTPIYNYQGLMGHLKFGHGSRDPNVVYIRNEVIRMEWEILLDRGSFEIEVLGHTAEQEVEDDELRHSSVLKFRRE